MVSFLGLRKEDALKKAEKDEVQLTLVSYSSNRGVENSDSEIVIRERFSNNQVELVVSEFKTTLL